MATATLHIRALLPLRVSDKHGAGHFGAPRGKRVHAGIDYGCPPKTRIFSPVTGRVTKVGYPYGDDLSFKYVEITDDNSFRHRVFYIEPDVHVGHLVARETIIGQAQDLTGRYPGITNHVHYEIRAKDGTPLNPSEFPIV